MKIQGERRKLIIEFLRDEKVTYKKIGKMFDVSGNRISQIHKKIIRKRKEKNLFSLDMVFDFNERTKNCLRSIGIDNVKILEERVRTKRDLWKLLHIRGCGKKSYNEVEKYLIEKSEVFNGR